MACLVKDVVRLGVGRPLALSFGTLDETTVSFARSFITLTSRSEDTVVRVDKLAEIRPAPGGMLATAAVAEEAQHVAF